MTDLLLLLLRLVLIACLVIAFAQPVVQPKISGNGSSSTVVGLYLDNSLSMELTEQGESYLTRAKHLAKDILQKFPPGSRFLLLFNGASGDLPGVTDKELTLSLINEIGPSADQLQMDDILRFYDQVNLTEKTELSSVVLISDFQESLFSKPLAINNSKTTLHIVSVKPMVTGNISIDTCWLDNPITLSGQHNFLSARINNRSGQDYDDFPVRLVINDTLRNETTIDLPARTISEVTLGFHPSSRGWQSGSVQISDFPVVFDNELLFSFRIESNIPILLLFDKEENSFLKSVFGDDPYFTFESFSNKGFPRSDFNNYNLVILSGISNLDAGLMARLRNFLATGGTVWFLPELTGNLSNYNEFLNSVHAPEIQSIIPYRIESALAPEQNQWLHEVVVTVDKRSRMPFFNQSLRMESLPPHRVDLLTTITGDFLFSQIKAGNGSLVLSGFPLDAMVTDLMFHPLFIPICYKIATMRINTPVLYQVIGQNQPVVVNRVNKPGDRVIRLKINDGSFEIIPAQLQGIGSETSLFPGNLPLSGHYLAISGTDTLASVAYNYSRAESNLEYLPFTEINQRLKNAGRSVPMNNNSFVVDNPDELAKSIAVKNIWFYFLIMALLAILAESFVMNKKK